MQVCGKKIRFKKELVPASVVFLFNSIGMGFVLPYMTLHARSRGLSISDVSLIYGLVPVISFSMVPVFGYVGDKFGYKFVMIASLVGCTTFGTALNFVPKHNAMGPRVRIEKRILDDKVAAAAGNASAAVRWLALYKDVDAGGCADALAAVSLVGLECDDKEVDVSMTFGRDGVVNTTFGACPGPEGDEGRGFCRFQFASGAGANETTVLCRGQAAAGDGREAGGGGDHAVTLWLYLFLRAAMTLFLNVVFNIQDATAMTVCRRANSDYSIVLLVGTVGTAVGSFITGPIIDNISFGEKAVDCLTGLDADAKSFVVPFLISDSLLLINVVFVYFFVSVEVEKPDRRTTVREDMAWVANPAAVGFIVLSLALGIVWGCTDSFTFIFLSEDLEASATLLGVINTVGQLSGVPFLLFGKSIVDRVGAVNMLVLGLLAFGLRMIAYSFASLVPPYDFLGYILAEILTFHLEWVASVMYAGTVAPRHLTATAIATTATCQFIIGKGFGSYAAGLLAARHGMRSMWRAVGAFGVVSAVLYWLLYHLWLKRTEVDWAAKGSGEKKPGEEREMEKVDGEGKCSGVDGPPESSITPL